MKRYFLFLPLFLSGCTPSATGTYVGTPLPVVATPVAVVVVPTAVPVPVANTPIPQLTKQEFVYVQRAGNLVINIQDLQTSIIVEAGNIPSGTANFMQAEISISQLRENSYELLPLVPSDLTDTMIAIDAAITNTNRAMRTIQDGNRMGDTQTIKSGISEMDKASREIAAIGNSIVAYLRQKAVTS